MKFVQATIEKVLSSLLGAEVRIASMNLSPLKGRVEAQNISIAGREPGMPVVFIRRIDAKIAVGKALAGIFELKSLLVEGPEIRVRRYGDGTFNIPNIAASPASKKEGESGGGWQFDAESIQVVGGRFSYEHDEYHSSAEGISGELKCHHGVIDCALRIGSLGRRDVPVEFGAFELEGEMDDHGGLAGVAVAPFRGEWRFEDGLRMCVESEGFSTGRAAIELHGPLDVQRWQEAVPENLLPPAIAALNFNGPVDADVRLDLSFAEGIKVREMNLRAVEPEIRETRNQKSE